MSAHTPLTSLYDSYVRTYTGKEFPNANYITRVTSVNSSNNKVQANARTNNKSLTILHQLSTNSFKIIGVGMGVGDRGVPKVLARACVNGAMFFKKSLDRRPIKP